MSPTSSDGLQTHFLPVGFTFLFFFFPTISPVADLNTGCLIYFYSEIKCIISYDPPIMYENSFSGHWFLLFPLDTSLPPRIKYFSLIILLRKFPF